MKTKATVLIILIMIVFGSFTGFAQEIPDSYMEFSATGEWNIFTKNMEDKELLSSVGKSAEEINEILNKTGSESLIVNKTTGAQIYLKIVKNDLSYELWNIQNTDNGYIKENLKSIVYDAFSLKSFNYQDEDVKINDYAYMKFLTIPGTAFAEEKGHGVIAGGTVVNGNAVVFTMVTNDITATDEEIHSVEEIAKSVSFTIIKDKEDSVLSNGNDGTDDVFDYVLGGFGALVLIIFCVYAITKIKVSDKEE